MTGLEDRLRNELSQLAALAQPETIHPLRDSAPRRRSAAARFLAPVAAMAAVAAVAIASAVIAARLPHRGATPVPAAPELVRSDTVPRFYVLADQSYVDGGRKFVTYAAVHSSATGGTLAQVSLPGLQYQGGYYTPSITGAANDRTFVVMETNHTSVDSIVWLFRLQVSASGRSIQVTRLSVHVPPTVAIDDVALSPDGSRLAMTAQWNCGQYRCQYTGIRVVDLATGAVTVWSTRANGAPFNGSWAGDHAVAFDWQPTTHGQAAAYPVVESLQIDGICREVYVPAPGLSEAAALEAQRIALTIAKELGVTGMLAVEMFETADGAVLINELAMRPHNSGHWTIDGAVTSQFENHLRAILGLPLGDTRATGYSAMINLIGTMPPRAELLRHAGVHLHDYAKEPRPGRKLGHLTVVEDTAQRCERRCSEVLPSIMRT